MNHPVYFIKQLNETTSTDSRQLFLLDPQHISTLGWEKVNFPKCFNILNTRLYKVQTAKI